jgi:hypothetical protein
LLVTPREWQISCGLAPDFLFIPEKKVSFPIGMQGPCQLREWRVKSAICAVYMGKIFSPWEYCRVDARPDAAICTFPVRNYYY